MTFFFALLAGLAIGALVAFLLQNRQFAPLKRELNEKQIALGLLQQQELRFQEEKALLNSQIQENAQTINQLHINLSEIREQNRNLQQKLAEGDTLIKEQIEKMNLQFKDMANAILEDKSKRFTEQNKSQIDQLLQPLRDRIGEFQKQVESTHKESLERHAGLFNELKNLKELNVQMSEEARNLTKALKGDNKAQGNWGEVILERILERSGLSRNQEYVVQDSLTTDDGRRLQPDITILLPEDKCLVIDSKVSLIDYERFASSDDEATQQQALKRHLQSIRNHVRELSAKNYSQLYGQSSPDFVLLFVPIEPAFILAVQNDPELFNDAFDKNIVIVSTSTLLASLRTIASIWRQENQNKNAQEIARQAGSLHEKFVSFVDDLIKVGSQLDTVEKTYKQAMNKLHEGKDNLVRKTERLKELGAKSSKQIDQRLLDRADN
ncbi:MAG: DNA recombination protein RmuC [Bacteroidia bacterium]